jgi:DNA repair exonuclease SbcCD nuclease subunit
MLAQAAYAEALEATPNAAFILHAGDIVESGEHANLWNRFFKALGNYGATIPHFAAIGNHDALQVSSEFYFDLHFNHPNNGGSSSLDTAYTSRLPSGSNLAALAKRADETFYSFNYGDAHFIVLNSGAYTAADQYLLEAQRAWLISDLQDNAHAKWTIVLVHEPVYHRRGGTESRPWLYDVIEG